MGDLSFAPQGDGPNFQMLSQLKLLSKPREKLSPSLQVESNCTRCYGPESFSQNSAKPHSASDQCPTHSRSLQQFFWNWPRANGRAKAERKLRPTRALSVASVGDPTTLEARHSSAKRPGRLVTAAPSACLDRDSSVLPAGTCLLQTLHHRRVAFEIHGITQAPLKG